MKEMTLKEIEAAINGRITRGNPKEKIDGVSHDSRNVRARDLFFALTGDVHDAHKFIPSVIETGCKNLVVSHMDWAEAGDENLQRLNIVEVKNVKTALQDLAAYYLNSRNVKVVGVTGSTGKTSTKDMVYAVCSEKYKTGKTVGNFNNDIGMPLTILGFDEDIEVAVLEMGMDRFGEIDLLAKIAKPAIGLITNIGISHMENLGSREGIMKAKMEITNYFDEKNSLIISTGEDFLRKENIKGEYTVIDTGLDENNDYVISDFKNLGEEGIEFYLTNKRNLNKNSEYKEDDICERQKFVLPVQGKHNALNCAMAVAAGELLGVTMEQAAKGLEKMELTGGRLTIKTSGSWKIIDDTYNASPDSMKGAVDVLEEAKNGEKIAILGDMYELGDDCVQWHRQIGEYAATHRIDKVIAVGEMAVHIAKGAGDKGMYFATKEDFIEEINKLVPHKATILVKGSRGMAMEKIVEALIFRGEKR